MSSYDQGKKTRPKVLILVKGLGLGGMERLLSQSIPHLDRDRFDYQICYLTPWKDDVVGAFEQAGIRVHCLDISSEFDPAALTRLWRLIREEDFDLVHSHSPYPSVLARVVSSARRGLKVVHTEHSLPDSRKRITRIANRLSYRWCDMVISVSADVDRAITSDGLPRPNETRVVRGGIDVPSVSKSRDRPKLRSELGIPNDHMVVGNLAHLRPQKGHTLFLEVALSVLVERPNTTFVLVGREKEPGFLDYLISIARELQIEDQVIFTGFIADPYPVLSIFDVFLMTSQHEGFPIALIESMAVGVPPVATDVGGVKEAITHGQNGLLAEFGDVATLSAQVLRLLDDDKQRSQMALSAVERVTSEFTIEQMVARVEAIYHEILAGPDKPGRVGSPRIAD